MQGATASLHRKPHGSSAKVTNALQLNPLPITHRSQLVIFHYRVVNHYQKLYFGVGYVPARAPITRNGRLAEHHQPCGDAIEGSMAG